MKYRNKRLLIFFVILIILLVLLGYIIYHAYYNYPQLSDLIPFPLQGHKRMLVLAPHCDDETLGSAGLIQAAQRAGIDVKVVIATNGDGYLFATMEDFHRLYPHHADFIRMGNLRQQESLNALKVLGVTPGQVIFLSYPDRGTPSLWNDNWFALDPYLSPYSGATRSPYPVTFNQASVYAGEDYLADLMTILDEYRPDLIIYPHPDDVHPDHWGLGAFTRLVVATFERNTPDYRPDLFAYLVHRRDFPEPKGYMPKMDLLPPRRLFDIEPIWFRLDIPPDDVNKKGEALNQYKSQLTLLGTLLDSFVRRNETFSQPQPVVLTRIKTGTPDDPDTWRDSLEHAVEPIQRDPERDFITREMISSADLVAVYASRDQEDRLFVCGQVREETKDALIYNLQVIEIGSHEIVHHEASNHFLKTGWHHLEFNDPYFCDQIELSAPGAPWALYVGANIGELGVGTLDQIAWQIIYLEPIK